MRRQSWKHQRDHAKVMQENRDRFLNRTSPPPPDPEEEKRLAALAKNFPVTKLPYMGDHFPEEP